jgi:hypothetical protein
MTIKIEVDINGEFDSTNESQLRQLLNGVLLQTREAALAYEAMNDKPKLAEAFQTLEDVIAAELS